MEFGVFSICRLEMIKYIVLVIVLIWMTELKRVVGKENNTLAFVIVMFHHGEISPKTTYPRDMYQEDHWPQGFGQLTELGVLQSYNLGVYLRQKYVDAGFLSSTYLRKEILIQSIDDDRCLMSAEAVLAGLYPPSDKQMWKSDLMWQPIPVHNMPQQLDKLFYDFPCSRLTKADEEMKTSNTITHLEDKYRDKLITLSNYTGYNFTSVFDENLRITFDALQSEKHNSLDVPAWAASGLVHEMESLFALLDFYKYNSTLQRRLRGGQLISEYIHLMNNKISSDGLEDVEPPKIVMFSSDDHTILSLLGSLGVYNNLTVPYSAAVITELFENQNEQGSYHVRFSYHNETTVKPYQLVIKGCVFHCPFSDFLYLTKDVVIEDIDKECRASNIVLFGISLDSLFTVVLMTIIIGLIALFLLLLCITCCCTKRWRHRKVRKYGRIRAETVPEEVPMMNTVGNGSDLDD